MLKLYSTETAVSIRQKTLDIDKRLQLLALLGRPMLCIKREGVVVNEKKEFENYFNAVDTDNAFRFFRLRQNFV